MAVQTDVAPLFAQLHQNYNQNIEQPSLSPLRNRMERKSDNYEIKETTPIHTSKRGTDTEWAGPTPTCGRPKF